MSWIGRKIYEYLKECEEFNKDLLVSYVSKKDNLGEPPRSEEYANQKILEYFKKTPKEKVLEDWNACQLHILFSGKSFAGLDKRKVGKEMSNAKGCVPKTENIPPEPIFPSDEYIDERKTAPEPPSVDELRSNAK